MANPNTFEELKLSETTVEEDDSEDRISLLPDGLLIDHILSRLPLTKDAIRTGVLSKRWQHLWPQNPNLNFTHHPVKEENLSPYGSTSDVDLLFLSSVHQTIPQCRQLNLNKFKLETYYDTKFESEVNSWISFAVSRNVKSLDITLKDSDKCHLVSDESVFVNSSFTHLVLKNCILKPTGAISWDKLRSLCISLHQTDEDLIQNVLSGSPVLETLELHIPCGYYHSRIDVSSTSVKKLVLEGCLTRSGFYADVEINAPNVLSLTIRGNLIARKYLLQDVSSLVEAELDYVISGFCFGKRKTFEAMILAKFMLKLCDVEKLTIRNKCLTALFRLKAFNFSFPSCLTFDATSPYFYDDGPESPEAEVGDL